MELLVKDYIQTFMMMLLSRHDNVIGFALITVTLKLYRNIYGIQEKSTVIAVSSGQPNQYFGFSFQPSEL
jgi:hypothetical protein